MAKLSLFWRHLVSCTRFFAIGAHRKEKSIDFQNYINDLKLYISCLDSCRVPRKYKNPMQGTKCFAGKAGSKVTSRPHYDTRRAAGGLGKIERSRLRSVFMSKRA